MADVPKPQARIPASPDPLCNLAEAYRSAAQQLLKAATSRHPLSRAPFRLLAIHAIELYLSALLLRQGHTPEAIRRMQHDLAARAQHAENAGLVLRRRTAMHLQSVSESGEYKVMRYAPEAIATAPQINRLTATLDEIAEKVMALLANPKRQESQPANPVVAKAPGKGRTTASVEQCGTASRR